MKKLIKMLACSTAAICLTSVAAACGKGKEETKGNFFLAGIEKAKETDYVSGATGLKSGEYSVVFTKKSAGYGVEIKTARGVLFLQEEPIEMSVSQKYGLIGTRESSISDGYESVKKHEYGISATAKLKTENGSVFCVSDLWFVSAEGTFGLSRNIDVEKAEASELGFNSSFKLKSVSESNDIDNYELTLPSLFYRDSSNIPSSAIGAHLDVSSLFAKETCMGMPYVLMRDKTTGHAAAISHYQPEVDGGVVLGGAHGEVNEDIRYGSLGFTNKPSEGLSAGFIWPCSEGPSYYGGTGWATRYHPIKQGVTHQYKLSVIPMENTAYNDAFTYATLKAYGAGSAALFDADLDAVYSSSFELLNTLYAENGTGSLKSAGLPFAVPLDEARKNSFHAPSMQMGFVGAQTSLAAQMIKYGYETENQELITKGRKMIDFWVGEAAYPLSSSLPYVWWDRYENVQGGSPRYTEAGRPYPGFLRILCDGMDGIMEACKYLELGGGVVPLSWMQSVLRVSEFFLNKQEADGSLRRAYDVVSGAINTDNSDQSYQGDSKINTASVVPFFYKISDYYKAQKNDVKANEYAQAAKAAAQYVYENIFLTLGKYVGGTIDQHNIVDKEAGIFALRAFTATYIATGEEKYLAAAEHAASFVLTFIYVYDFSVPCADEGQNRYNPFKNGGASGFSIIATGHSNSDIFSAYTVYDFYKMYVLTGKQVWKDIAVFVENNSKQAVDYDGRHGFLYKGTSPEASGLYRFSYSTVDTPGIWLPWNTDACVRPMSDLDYMFGALEIERIAYGLEEQKQLLLEYGLGGKVKTN